MGVEVHSGALFVIVLLSLLLFLVFGVGFYGLRWILFYFRIRQNIIEVAYRPPADLTPAEVGYLFDNKVTTRQMAATVIDLVQKGLLGLSKNEAGRKVLLARADDSEKRHEKSIVRYVAENSGVDIEKALGRDQGRPKDIQGLNKWSFSLQVHDELEAAGLVVGSAGRQFSVVVLRLFFGVFILCVVVPYLLYWGGGIFGAGAASREDVRSAVQLMVYILILLPIVILETGLLLKIRTRLYGRTWIMTPKSRRLRPQIVSFKIFTHAVERNKLKYQTPELASRVSRETLPYAVALGYVKNWRSIIH